MCEFFSCITNGLGDIKYFDWSIREKILVGKLNYEHDGHSSIAHYYGVDEDRWNKFEFDPITKIFKTNQINAYKDDSEYVEKFCRELDFKTIVPQLIIKKIFHPFIDRNRKRISKSDIKLLHRYTKVKDSVWVSVGNSVENSVGNSVGNSVWESVWESVGISVKDSVIDSIWEPIKDSIWDFIGVYYSSFFNLDKWEKIKHKKDINPFQPGIDLWERGIVPSYDGEVWRLHGGEDAKVLWEEKVKS